ncbi:class I SAM-dependent methyltransferase [Mycolicibacter senuensis]|uniref:Transcriptional regulator n=1 Tax=Mycolicibacter senuensis TaxID=386913 RepID=A0A7I9XHJ0_9MYCO|nr:class I SAM-dependent methyltransferase [Mycolicibacter senuensis]ORW65403.1 methyltransferase [Mycolicibacter senuensis]GFG68950.1 transcriptional regulator [Mycolicibacter senuensis]
MTTPAAGGQPTESTEDTGAFADRVTDALDAASLALLLSLGHQSGLFDAMVALPAPATSVQIADAAGLSERYVREWLGGMTVAGVVDYHPATATYRLPEHRAAVLTRAAGPANLARVAQYIALLGEVEQQVLSCFRDGGGLAYSEYPRFHTVMAERSGEVFDTALVEVVLPLVEGLPQRLRAGADVADFGCGSGHAVNVMAQEFSNSRFTGIDFSAEGIARASREAAQRGLTNATFESSDLTTFDRAGAYDLVTAFDAIHDQAQPARVLENIHRSLRVGGILLMADAKASSRLEDNVGVATNTYRYTVSLMHCMPVSLALDGAGLGTMWGRQLAMSMLADAGFADVVFTEIAEDPSNYYYIATKR